MADREALDEFKQGMRMLRDRKPNVALVHFRKATETEKQNPYYMSFTGVALARAKMKWEPAVKLCEMALTLQRKEMQLHLNLAEVYMYAGRREEALIVLDRAEASFGRQAGLEKARMRLGSRRAPVLSFLSRENAVNRELGILRHRLFNWAEGARLPLLHSS